MAQAYSTEGVKGPHLMSVARFERFFRETGGLDVDKEDLRRYTDFVNDKLYDMLIRAQAVAHANIRDVIQPHDLPIGNGLQENIIRFRRMDQEIQLKPILDHLANRPPLDKTLSDETEAELPNVVGGLSVAMAHAFKILDPDVKNPHGEQWDRLEKDFNELL
jgi:hypothetical protein